MGESADKKTQPSSADGSSASSSKRRRGNKKKRNGNKPTVPKVKFEGGKEELDGNHFDCTGYGQSDKFLKTVQKIADYIEQEYKCGGVTRTEVMTQTPNVIPMPTRPVSISTAAADGTVTIPPPDILDISDYQSEKKIAGYKIQHQTKNQQKVFSLVRQQCTESIQAKIKAHRDYKTIEQELNGIDLLRVIKLICFNIEDEKYVPQKVYETKTAFYALRQGRDSDQAYQIKFMNIVQVIQQCGASLGEDPLTRIMVCKDLGYQANTTTASALLEITKTVRDYTLGAALILGADPDRYSNMIRRLMNISLAGCDEWPKTITEAYNYLSKWEGDDVSIGVSRDYEGTAFTNSERVREPQPCWHAKMTCQNCNKVGHIASFCENNKVSTTNVQVTDTRIPKDAHEEASQQLLNAIQQEANDQDYYADLFLCEHQDYRSASFLTKDGVNGGRVPKEWILLDSQSTTDAFSNPDLLRNIHEVRGSLTIHTGTQVGKAITKLRGTVPGYGEVWYCPNGIATILSLAHVAKTHLVTFNRINGCNMRLSKKRRRAHD
jgi:hypothetical protein